MSSTRSQWDGVALRLTGLSAYRPAWALQREIWERRRQLQLPDTLIVLEHEPVITIGRHGDERFLRLPGNAAHAGSAHAARPALLAPTAQAAHAPEVVRIDRGGEITYHGPGQITAYLIADLRAHDLGVRAFVHALEDAVLRTLRDFAIEAFRRDGLVGVWSHLGDRPAKVAAAGVRIARGVSLHGIALNVDNRCLGLPLDGALRAGGRTGDHDGGAAGCSRRAARGSAWTGARCAARARVRPAAARCLQRRGRAPVYAHGRGVRAGAAVAEPGWACVRG